MSNFLKVVLLGESGVGKTALLDRFVHKRFTGSFKSTIGADFLTQELELDKKLVTLQIWDTAGQERFNSLGRIYYRGADCCLLVFDVTRSKSLQDLSFWRQEFIKNANIDPDNFTFLLLGNRCDLDSEREVSSQMAQEWCRTHGALEYVETSAKTGANVDKAFRLAVQDVLRRTAADRVLEHASSGSGSGSHSTGDTLSQDQLAAAQRKPKKEEGCC